MPRMNQSMIVCIAEAAAMLVALSFVIAVAQAVSPPPTPHSNDAAPSEPIKIVVRREDFCRDTAGECSAPRLKDVFDRFRVPADMQEATRDRLLDSYGCRGREKQFAWGEIVEIFSSPREHQIHNPACPPAS